MTIANNTAELRFSESTLPYIPRERSKSFKRTAFTRWGRRRTRCYCCNRRGPRQTSRGLLAYVIQEEKGVRRHAGIFGYKFPKCNTLIRPKGRRYRFRLHCSNIATLAICSLESRLYRLCLSHFPTAIKSLRSLDGGFEGSILSSSSITSTRVSRKKKSYPYSTFLTPRTASKGGH
jgi:hypothetical protein